MLLCRRVKLINEMHRLHCCALMTHTRKKFSKRSRTAQSTYPHYNRLYCTYSVNDTVSKVGRYTFVWIYDKYIFISYTSRYVLHTIVIFLALFSCTYTHTHHSVAFLHHFNINNDNNNNGNIYDGCVIYSFFRTEKMFLDRCTRGMYIYLPEGHAPIYQPVQPIINTAVYRAVCTKTHPAAVHHHNVYIVHVCGVIIHRRQPLKALLSNCFYAKMKTKVRRPSPSPLSRQPCSYTSVYYTI